jgi:hypothetical protein
MHWVGPHSAVADRVTTINQTMMPSRTVEEITDEKSGFVDLL